MTQVPSVFTDTYTPDNLIAGTTQLATRSYVFAAGQVLQRGTMVGVVQATGKAVISNQTATDGTQIPIGILADSVDASAGDALAPVYLKGEFNENAVIFGTGWTIANAFANLRAMQVYLKPVVAASGQYL